MITHNATNRPPSFIGGGIFYPIQRTMENNKMNQQQQKHAIVQMLIDQHNDFINEYGATVYECVLFAAKNTGVDHYTPRFVSALARDKMQPDATDTQLLSVVDLVDGLFDFTL